MSSVDSLLDNALKKLDYDFRKLRKRLDSYKNVIDITSLSKEELAKVKSIIGKDGIINIKRGYAIVPDSKLKNIDRYLVAQGKEKALESNGKVIKDTILTLSRDATAEFSSSVTNKVESTLKYAAPDVRVKFVDKVGSKLSRYKLEFTGLSKDADEEVKRKFISSIRTSVLKSINTAAKDNPIDSIINRRVESILHAFKTGKDIDKSINTSYSMENKVRSKPKKYYSPVQDTRGVFTSITSLTNTINLLLHDTIRDNYMKESSAPVSTDYLRYQTGRFAMSARAEGITKTDTTLTVSYSYMSFPYSVYEAYSSNRDPKRIIGGAIQEIMAQLVHNKFKVMTSRI